MLRIIKLSLANLFLLLNVYTFCVLGYHCIKYNEARTGGIIVIVLMLILLGFGIYLCCSSYKKHRFGRFNIDIFTTVYLFVIFMLGFVVPSHIRVQLTHASGFFWYLSPIVYHLGDNSVGIYEIFLFLAFLFNGLTIGEHKQKYYE